MPPAVAGNAWSAASRIYDGTPARQLELPHASRKGEGGAAEGSNGDVENDIIGISTISDLNCGTPYINRSDCCQKVYCGLCIETCDTRGTKKCV